MKNKYIILSIILATNSYLYGGDTNQIENASIFTSAIPCVADFDGDGKSDPAVYYPGSGTWVIKCSKYNWEQRILPGIPGGTPLVGDYDGDGLADPTSYTSGVGQWVVLLSGQNYAFVVFTLGATGPF